MKYSVEYLEQTLATALQGRSPEVYLRDGCNRLVDFCRQGSNRWKLFGPYWSVVRQLLASHRPDFAQADHWHGGESAPDYLSFYDYGNEVYNLCAALAYLSRGGDYINLDQPHSIDLPDGSQALYDPDTGIVYDDTGGDRPR